MVNHDYKNAYILAGNMQTYYEKWCLNTSQICGLQTYYQFTLSGFEDFGAVYLAADLYILDFFTTVLLTHSIPASVTIETQYIIRYIKRQYL